jgi:S-DNA-T family DNA segregation ATPase FtsK/SpoIIIE
MNIKKTADLLINFAIKRLAEILGLTIFIAGIMLLLALASYSPEDPNFIFPDGTKIKNLLGFNGSFHLRFIFSIYWSHSIFVVFHIYYNWF